MAESAWSRPAWLEVFGVALRLGLTSFGGPIAHLGYFHKEYVRLRRWVDEPTYTDLVALCQALPGPTSSQVGMAIGSTRAGFAGALAAWVGFTLPSALIMAGFGVLWVNQALVPGFGALVHGLGLVAVVVVAQAVWLMGRTALAGKTPVRAGLAAGVFLAQALVPSPLTPLLGLAASAAVGFAAFRDQGLPPPPDTVRRPWPAIGALIAFGLLLVGLPWLRALDPPGLVVLTDALYRTGALVFGGGHVVLPLLQQELVAPGLVDPQAFLAGYGVAQALPGPLFSLAAYLGFLVAGAPGAVVGLVALFLPSFLLVQGLVPFWQRLKAWGWFRRALAGVNAGVVGLLAWAWYDPVCTTAVRGPLEVVVAAVLGVGLIVFRLPAWVIVLGGAAAGLALQAIGN